MGKMGIKQQITLILCDHFIAVKANTVNNIRIKYTSIYIVNIVQFCFGLVFNMGFLHGLFEARR